MSQIRFEWNWLAMRISPVLNFFEKAFWFISGFITLASAIFIAVKGGYHIFQDIGALNDVLKKEIFYSIICFELFQMARIRLEERPHKIVLYHFIFMATLTFGREIFLIHNLDVWNVFGFISMIVIYMVFESWRSTPTE